MSTFRKFIRNQQLLLVKAAINKFHVLSRCQMKFQTVPAKKNIDSSEEFEKLYADSVARSHKTCTRVRKIILWLLLERSVKNMLLSPVKSPQPVFLSLVWVAHAKYLYNWFLMHQNDEWLGKCYFQSGCCSSNKTRVAPTLNVWLILRFLKWTTERQRARLIFLRRPYFIERRQLSSLKSFRLVDIRYNENR